jgi:hypothetical protein
MKKTDRTKGKHHARCSSSPPSMRKGAHRFYWSSQSSFLPFTGKTRFRPCQRNGLAPPGFQQAGEAGFVVRRNAKKKSRWKAGLNIEMG